jgi:outer membrane lipoprotein LolB
VNFESSNLFDVRMMILPRRLCRLVLLVAMLGGCATYRMPSTGPASPESLWLDRQSQLVFLDQWLASGRIAFHAHGRGGSASFLWRQERDRYNIHLSGPLGTKAVDIQGDGRSATLTIAGKSGEAGATPDQLIADMLGWKVPISGLRYWVRGLPAPRRKKNMKLNVLGQLTMLEQDGWHIDFNAYQELGQRSLPKRIVLERSEATVRLVIDEWNIPVNDVRGRQAQ